jgi:diguanylate cyclase (GGDEF)-like protein
LQRLVRRRTAALRRTAERLRQLATTDELTGLYNRRFFLERWQWEFERSKRYGRPLACLMIDVDGFKQVNDVVGHHAGDFILKQVAQELTTHLRQSDILARFGGDEFIGALPETSLEQATAVAEKLRGLAFRGPWTNHQHLGPVRLSVGLSYMQANESAEQAIQNADAALYASRQAAKTDRMTHAVRR